MNISRFEMIWENNREKVFFDWDGKEAEYVPKLFAIMDEWSNNSLSDKSLFRMFCSFDALYKNPYENGIRIPTAELLRYGVELLRVNEENNDVSIREISWETKRNIAWLVYFANQIKQTVSDNKSDYSLDYLTCLDNVEAALMQLNREREENPLLFRKALDTEVATSLQVNMAEYLLGIFRDGGEILTANPFFALIICKVHGRKSVIITRSGLFPDFSNDKVKAQLIKYNDYLVDALAQNEWLADYDWYAVGIEAKRKNGTCEEEWAEYVFDETYQVVIGKYYLMRRAFGDETGYELEKPIPLSNVHDEYVYLEQLVSEYGVIMDMKREGSESGRHITDRWNVVIYDGTFEFEMMLYLDPYERPIHNWLLSKKAPTGFSFEE